MDCSTPGLPVYHYLPKFAQVEIHWVGVAIQPTHPLPPSSPFAFNLSQHKGLFSFQTMVLEKTLESPLDSKEIKPVLKEINPEYSLEGLMVKLKLHYFGHLIQTANLLGRSSHGTPLFEILFGF